jgi:cardiolipin synthase
MAQHGAVNRRRAGAGARGWLILLLAASLTGCQAPPACDGRDPGLPRPAVLARQVIKDTALETAQHPARTSAAALYQTADTLGAVGRGVIVKRFLLPLRGLPDPPEPCRPTLDPAALEADLRKITRCALEPAEVTLYDDGPEALAALLRLIDGACGRIDVLMFIWENDAVGRAIAEHLAAKAAAGVPVRAVVDGGGNLIYSEPDTAPAAEVNRAVCWLARQPNVQVLRARDGGARFDHRKLVVVDGQVAWTGGRNFREGAFGKQHDVSVTLTGPLAGKLSREFERAWKEHGGPATARTEGAAPLLTAPNAQARIIGTGPLRHDLADTLFCAIDHARHHVYLENPYLCDGRLLLRLMAARRRGVDVRAVFTLCASEAIANHANRVTANFLLRAGVRVYLYEGPTHLKALSVDGAWAYLGTGNFDPLSLRHDYEVGLALGDGPLVRQVEEQVLEPDFRPDWELHEPLPVTTVDRLSEVLAALFG